MRREVIAFEYVRKFHFDRVAGTVTDCTFRTNCYDQEVVKLRRSLFDCADDIFSKIAGQPFVNRRHLRSKTLQLVNGHWADFEQRTSEEVLDTLLGRRKFHSIGSRTGS